jgi:tRNA (guanine37-N1)-methyltransferase
MNFSIVSIFPDMLKNFITYGLIDKAIEKKLVNIDVYDLRDFTTNKHKKVDDKPFGGGSGMVMKPEPLFNAVNHIQKKMKGKVILFSAYAELLTQKKIKELSNEDHLILLCGRYEGVDQRVIDEIVDEEISIGEYVLMGGEVAAEVILESVSRMIYGVIGNPESVKTDSFFYDNQFAFPQYTQPRDYKDLKVPEVLLSGNHRDIIEWRKRNKKRRKT